MKSFAITAAGTLVIMLAGTPSYAAQDMRTTSDQGRQIGGFAGATVRLPIGGKAGVKPTARLQMGMITRSQGTRPLSPHGLELGLTGKGKPEMFVGGRSSREMRERLKLTGSTSDTIWIVFGVALVAVTILVVSNLDDLGDSVP